MAKRRKLTPFGIFLWLILFAIGFGIGWQNRNSKWNHELEMAADQWASRESGMYVPEFRGVVYLELPNEPTEAELNLIERFRDRQIEQ